MISKYHLYAPFDGNLMEVFTQFGTVVNPGSQIARIIQTGNLEVEVPVQVEVANFLHVGDKAAISTEGKSVKYEGRIIRMGRYVNPNTQSIDVFVSIDATAADKMYDGMYVELEVKADTLEDVIKIPRKALIGKEEIYLVQDTLLIRRKIELKAKDETDAYISGVENGEYIVIEALSNPVDSMVVHNLASDD
jgi:multidrug efflux pump subunit AcrA (membrane-fusion protein)